MFLKEVESRPATGIALIALRKMRDEGRTIPDILHLFRYKTRSTDHLVRFTDEVMRGPSPLTPGLRELIGAYVSKKNQYAFCTLAHTMSWPMPGPVGTATAPSRETVTGGSTRSSSK